jgi:hypothetical protein
MAQKKITQLPLDTAVTGPDVVPIVSDGATKRVTLTTLSSFFAAAGATGPTGAAGGAGSAGATGPTGPAGAGEIYQSDTAPSVAAVGATWLDTATGKYFTRYAGLWVEVGGKHYP